MESLKYLSILLVILILPMISADYGYCNPNLPGGNTCNPSGVNANDIINRINYSYYNVNDSTYWQGHTGTDGSWLTGILYNYNQTIPANVYTNTINDSLVNWINNLVTTIYSYMNTTYVPYNNANQNVDLGNYNLTAKTTFQDRICLDTSCNVTIYKENDYMVQETIVT